MLCCGRVDNSYRYICHPEKYTDSKVYNPDRYDNHFLNYPKLKKELGYWCYCYPMREEICYDCKQDIPIVLMRKRHKPERINGVWTDQFTDITYDKWNNDEIMKDREYKFLRPGEPGNDTKEEINLCIKCWIHRELKAQVLLDSTVFSNSVV
jgi:hypothetical protein